MKESLIYLASPYSHSEFAICEQRYKTVCRVAARLMSEGYNIFCPIAHSHAIAVEGGLNHLDWNLFQKQDIPFLDACTEIWVVAMPGWKESLGVSFEIDYMILQNKPVKIIHATEADSATKQAVEDMQTQPILG